MVFGDTDWLLNVNFGWYGNADLFLNTFHWLSTAESSISIRPKSLRSAFVRISEEDLLLFVLIGFLAPECFLIFGLWIWWSRRDRVHHGLVPA